MPSEWWRRWNINAINRNRNMKYVLSSAMVRWPKANDGQMRAWQRSFGVRDEYFVLIFVRCQIHCVVRCSTEYRSQSCQSNRYEIPNHNATCTRIPVQQTHVFDDFWISNACEWLCRNISNRFNFNFYVDNELWRQSFALSLSPFVIINISNWMNETFLIEHEFKWWNDGAHE